MAELILSAFSDEYADDFSEQLEAMNRFGIGFIELRFVNKKNVADLTTEEVETVRNQLTDAGIKVSAIGSPLGKVAINSDWQSHLDQTKRICETACRLGTGFVRMFSFYLPEGEDPLHYRGQVLDRLGRMLDIADSYGITFGHENEARIYGDSPERCLDLLESFRGRLRCVFDMGNFVLEGHDPWPKAYESLKPYLGWFHIKDALGAGAIVPAGKGEACIGQILRDYRQSGSGSVFVTLEPHLQTFSGLNAIKGKAFENPYKYPDQQTAFADAVENLREVLA